MNVVAVWGGSAADSAPDKKGLDGRRPGTERGARKLAVGGREKDACRLFREEGVAV